MRYPAPAARRRHAWLPAVTLTLAPLVVLAGCGGSAISPETALAANERVLGRTTGQSAGVDAPQVPSQGGSAAPVPGGGSTGNPLAGPGATDSPASDGLGGSSDNPRDAAPPGGGGGPAVKPASCDGFRNTTGVTNSTITIGNTADVSGPIPGLFVSAQQAVKAYVAYFNASSTICGRKLALNNYDSRTDAGANQTSYAKMCDQTFAAIGSMSAFDSGGARTAQSCGLPDILSSAITPERNACSTCFGIQTSGEGQFNNETYDFWVKKDKAATQKAAFLYINTGAAASNGKVQISVGKKNGMNWVYTSPIDVADFNYGPYVQQMKSKGVEFVQFLGGYQQGIRLLQSMQQSNFSPRIRFFDQSVYDEGFLKSGGSAINGAYLSITFTPFEEHQKELDLYKAWLGQVAPGATPAFAGLFAWSAAKLFVQEALALGGKLTRASLIAKLRSVDNWTGGGMHVPMHVGTKQTAACVRFMTVTNGHFAPYGPTKYQCNGISKG